MKSYFRPLGFLSGDAAKHAVAERRALTLAGGPLAFALVEVIERRGDGDIARRVLPAAPLAGLLGNHTAPRARIAELPVECPLIMGIVNVTPDSFSDGGALRDPGEAVARGELMLRAGANIVDVGGESTRPGALAVTVEEEIRRVTPVIAGLSESAHAFRALISIDTRNAKTMEAGLRAGARIINDVSALVHADSMSIVAQSDASIVLMHMQGKPETMQRAPIYDDVVLDVFDFLDARVAACVAAGIARDRIVIDPGIGFGKTIAHNLALLSHLSLFHGLGARLLVGVSRKAFIANLSRREPPLERFPGSIAAALAAIGQGVQILRVHDVTDTVQAVKIALALRNG